MKWNKGLFGEGNTGRKEAWIQLFLLSCCFVGVIQRALFSLKLTESSGNAKEVILTKSVPFISGFVWYLTLLCPHPFQPLLTSSSWKITSYFSDFWGARIWFSSHHMLWECLGTESNVGKSQVWGIYFAGEDQGQGSNYSRAFPVWWVDSWLSTSSAVAAYFWIMAEEPGLQPGSQHY